MEATPFCADRPHDVAGGQVALLRLLLLGRLPADQALVPDRDPARIEKRDRKQHEQGDRKQKKALEHDGKTKGQAETCPVNMPLDGRICEFEH